MYVYVCMRFCVWTSARARKNAGERNPLNINVTFHSDLRRVTFLDLSYFQFTFSLRYGLVYPSFLFPLFSFFIIRSFFFSFIFMLLFPFFLLFCSFFIYCSLSLYFIFLSSFFLFFFPCIFVYLKFSNPLSLSSCLLLSFCIFCSFFFQLLASFFSPFFILDSALFFLSTLSHPGVAA